MCPSNQDGIPFFQGGRVSQVSGVRVRGLVYNLQDLNPLLVQRGFGNVSAWVDQDLTPAFQAASCKSQGSCVTNSIYGGTWPDSTKGCVPNSLLSNLPTTRLVFEWSFVPNDVVVYNNCALNVSSILNQPDLSPRLVDLIKQSGGRDVTLQVASDANQVNQMKCLMERATIGYIGSQSPSCTVYNALTTTALVTVLGLILIRFLMAFIFHWFIAPTLSKPTVARLGRPGTYLASRDYPKDTQSVFDQGWAKSAPLPSDLYTICLVTCYSEGESAIRHTLDSLSATDYPDERKLLFVICDGLIVGQGNSKSTPDIVVDMIEEDTSVGPALPRSYLAIADGTRQHNMARVHCGYYPYKSKRVPIVVVVKCGTDQEQSDKKPGNRGKRDSQVILMKFLNRVTFNDRMTALDYDLFYKIQQIACVTPDVYELVLMVDADTSVNTDSLGYMVQTMVNDENVMGLCGETRITNKRESWVTRIQVYEYFTSHNLGKAFESVFGRVTCLPGCFCMYRIKARKNSEWMVPLIINPDVVENYSEHVVDTLHLKNLLLLGEDRYLSTLMLKTFPKRKMVFVPQAICHTTVPHTFKMLLSQRRRWINSTIHNLLELMLVPNLCGIFCFSMKFVIALELLGTVSLPAAICFTFWLIIASLAGNVSVQPLVMLLFALFLPGLLVITTTNKPIYLMWMLYYLAALPVWNFVLPIYSFWHFDDFSWGDTRRVQGETKQTDHSNRDGEYEIGSVPMKTYFC
ncbi:chitin synthase [Gorgonomyces haynaldii]|nr:chitin synthase [Gorgonomyces haynaldii]